MIALYFGSFNPLHIGHLAIANYVLEFTEVKQLYLVITPKNPIKQESSNFTPTERLEKIKDSLTKFDLNIKVSDIEFNMQAPFYTINTLELFKAENPTEEFTIIIGADNLAIIDKWHRYKDILNYYQVWIYPRKGYNLKQLLNKYHSKGYNNIKAINAPIIEISSTMIREGEMQGHNMNGFKII